ncbi:MAG: hypothetical protein B6D59_02530 [Campylobacteraceae bacterium 4484_4]|nr:MAG: hypothetical protein B6D59_02530 [Campylobacteraceae bacterium 4484_4]
MFEYLRAHTQILWSALFILLFALLSLQSTKIGGARVGQIYLLALFGIIFLCDLQKRRIAYEVFLFFWLSATIMALISFASIYPKIGESKFLIKYFLIFPAAYYLGMRMTDRISVEKLIMVLEISALFDALMAYMIYFLPMPPFIMSLVHFRDAAYGAVYLDFQGTFFEAGVYAYAVGALFFGALLLRIDYHIWPRRKWLYALYFATIILSFFLSTNKTVWIALIVIMIFLILYKSIRLLGHSSRYQPDGIRNRDRSLKLLSKINTLYAIGLIFLVVLSFWLVNELMPRPMITMELIRIKLEQERGKAFLIILDLLRQSRWIGGYGFGFVEYYFGVTPVDVIGLGEGVSMVFNSFLDIWLSVSIFGVLFMLLLLFFSFSTLSFFTMAIPIYFFVFANFNPVAASEEFFLFLGISYGFIQRLKNGH